MFIICKFEHQILVPPFPIRHSPLESPVANIKLLYIHPVHQSLIHPFTTKHHMCHIVRYRGHDRIVVIIIPDGTSPLCLHLVIPITKYMVVDLLLPVIVLPSSACGGGWRLPRIASVDAVHTTACGAKWLTALLLWLWSSSWVWSLIVAQLTPCSSVPQWDSYVIATFVAHIIIVPPSSLVVWHPTRSCLQRWSGCTVVVGQPSAQWWRSVGCIGRCHAVVRQNLL